MVESRREVSTPMPLGGPPPGLAQLPPMAPGAGLPPSPAAGLLQQATGLQQASDTINAAATSAQMLLAQMLGDQASPEAMAAQSSPSPGLPNVGAISGS